MGEFYLMTRKRLRRQVIEFVDVRGFDDPQPGASVGQLNEQLCFQPKHDRTHPPFGIDEPARGLSRRLSLKSTTDAAGHLLTSGKRQG